MGRPLPESQTVEGLFAALPPEDRLRLGVALAGRVRQAVVQRVGGRLEVAVALVNMQAELLGCDGDLAQWSWSEVASGSCGFEHQADEVCS
jgi:hypothetical protein